MSFFKIWSCVWFFVFFAALIGLAWGDLTMGLQICRNRFSGGGTSTILITQIILSLIIAYLHEIPELLASSIMGKNFSWGFGVVFGACLLLVITARVPMFISLVKNKVQK